MTKTLRLNDLQLVLLSNATARDNGSIVPLPESCNQDKTRVGKAVASLLRHGLVEEIPVIDRNLTWREEDQETIGLFITEAGCAAIGAGDDTGQTGDNQEAGPKSEPMQSAEQTQSAKTAAEGEQSPQPNEANVPPAASAPRAGSKIATVIALLQRDEGATLDEMVAATGWQPHTTRAALTGLKKKGHVLAKSKRGEVTCYRIAGEG